MSRAGQIESLDGTNVPKCTERDNLAASGGGEQPRGWLTEEERDLIAGITDDDEYTEEGQNIAKALLARSSPPEVVLKDFPPDTIRNLESHYLAGWNQCMALAKKAIAAAGLPVKEVGGD